MTAPAEAPAGGLPAAPRHRAYRPAPGPPAHQMASHQDQKAAHSYSNSRSGYMSGSARETENAGALLRVGRALAHPAKQLPAVPGLAARKINHDRLPGRQLTLVQPHCQDPGPGIQTDHIAIL